MTRKELSKYFYLSLEIKDLEEKIETLNTESISSSKITGMPVYHTNESPIERKVQLLIEYKNKLEKRKVRAMEEMIKIEKFISTIDDIETRLIFNKRYIELKAWDDIAEEMNMCERTAYRKHKKYLGRSCQDDRKGN